MTLKCIFLKKHDYNEYSKLDFFLQRMHNRSEVMTGEEHSLVNLVVLLFLENHIFFTSFIDKTIGGKPAKYIPLSVYLDNSKNSFHM